MITMMPHLQAAAEFQIQHDPLVCTVAGLPIEISFEVISPTFLKEARVYFREQKTEHFYFIQAALKNSGTYSGILPGPIATVKAVEYFLLVADEDENVMKSPVFSVSVAEKSSCPQYRSVELPMKLIVSAEQEISPEIGFSGENVDWATSGDSPGTPYMDKAIEKPVQSGTTASMEQNKDVSKSGNPRFGKKTLIGLGAGLGAIAVIGAAAGGGGDGGDGNIWNSLSDEASDVTAELIKSPEIQTSCGTVVTNQLFVTNNRAEDILIGTIDFEIALTKDNPEGSCEPGRTGAFAPNLATVVHPGEIALIRQWSNEVNPCSGCPYLIAECIWESRYIVHTSAGSAAALSSFSTEGDLCGTLTTKPFDGNTQVQGDVEP